MIRSLICRAQSKIIHHMMHHGTIVHHDKTMMGFHEKNKKTAGVWSANNNTSGYDWQEINATHHAKCFLSVSVTQQTGSGKKQSVSSLSCSVSVRWHMWPRSGWVEIGGPGAERLPPPALRWTWRSSRSTCRSTRWRSSLCAHLRRLRPPWGNKRTHTPIRAPGS